MHFIRIIQLCPCVDENSIRPSDFTNVVNSCKFMTKETPPQKNSPYFKYMRAEISGWGFKKTESQLSSSLFFFFKFFKP